MQALLWDEKVKGDLQRLKEYAERHHFSIDELLDRMNGSTAPGDMPEFCCIIPVGLKVVYTIEPATTGQLIRHLSVSYRDKTPSVPIVELIMTELGFKSKLTDPGCNVAREGEAINVAELYE